MAKRDYTLTFSLKAYCGFGNHMVVFGDCPELGDGDIKKAVPLEYVGGPYPWAVNITFTDSPANKWYKFAVVKSTGDIIYENIPDRHVSPFDRRLILFDTFDTVPQFSNILVRFRVAYYTNWGQDIFIVGSIPELGEWDTRKAFALQYLDSQHWAGSLSLPINSEPRVIKYRYFVKNSNGEKIWEPGEEHSFTLTPCISPTIFEITDPFRWADPVLDALVRSPFAEVFNQRFSIDAPLKFETNTTPDTIRVLFSVLCPVPSQKQRIAVAGSIAELGWWQPQDAFMLCDKKFPLWSGFVTISRSSFPFEYKYIMLDTDNNVLWESRENRVLEPADPPGLDLSYPVSLLCHDWMPSIRPKPFKGVALSVDLLKIRTRKSCGCGQFGDLCRLVDLCKAAGAAMIQLRNVNDSESADGPLASAFALNPIFIDLTNIQRLSPEIETEVKNVAADFAEEPGFDYGNVLSTKLRLLRQIYNSAKDEIAADVSFAEFREENAQWLNPYALYCALRVERGSADLPPFDLRLLKENESEAFFHAWVQFVAARQLTEARQYAVSNKVALRGELPVGVSTGSVDVWASPSAFRPYEEVVEGRRLGSAAHAWGTTSLEWWDARLKHFARFFHSVRVDELERFLRVYEAPTGLPVTAGHFSTDPSFTRAELKEKRLWDVSRYRKPYVRGHLLPSLFGDDANFVTANFLKIRGQSARDSMLEFQDGIDSVESIRRRLLELKVDEGRASIIERGLVSLLTNTLLTEDAGRPGNFYITRELGKTSWRELPEPQRSIFAEEIRKLNELQAAREGDLLEGAMARLRLLQESTRMEVVGGKMHADLRTTPLVAAMPEAREESGRYNAVAAVAELRGLFRTPNKIEGFWKGLGRTDATPAQYNAFVDDVMVRQVMFSEAEWAVVDLEAVVLNDDQLELAKPGMPYPWTIEELIKNGFYTSRIAKIVEASGRAHEEAFPSV